MGGGNRLDWYKRMRVLWLALVLTASASAGEYVTFASGSRLRVDRHEAEGPKVRLYADGAVMVVDAAQVRGFEAEEYAPPAAAEAVTAPAAAASPTVAPAPDDLADRAPAPAAAGARVQIAFRRHQAKAVAHQAALERQQAACGPPRGGGPSADPQPPAGCEDARELQELASRRGLSGQAFRAPDGPAGPFAHREDAAAQVAFHE